MLKRRLVQETDGLRKPEPSHDHRKAVLDPRTYRQLAAVPRVHVVIDFITAPAHTLVGTVLRMRYLGGASKTSYVDIY